VYHMRFILIFNHNIIVIMGFQICLQSIDCAYILQDEEKIIEHVNTVLMPMDPNVHQMTDQRSMNKTVYQM
jgi:hypothetical protein